MSKSATLNSIFESINCEPFCCLFSSSILKLRETKPTFKNFFAKSKNFSKITIHSIEYSDYEKNDALDMNDYE